MGNEINELVNKKFKKKRTKRIVIIFIVITILSLGMYYFFVRTKNDDNTKYNIESNKVEKGNIEIVISGTGTIRSTQKQEAYFDKPSKVLEILHHEGEVVKSGELMMRLDSTDEKKNLDKLYVSLEEAKISLDKSLNDLDDLKVSAPFSGVISNIMIKENDKVSNSTKFYSITDKSRLKIVVPFSFDIAKEIKEGTNANVYVQDIRATAKATVSYVGQNEFIDTNGSKVVNIELIVENPGALEQDMIATAEININGNDYASTNSAKLSYLISSIETSKIEGTITKLNFRENDFVNKGQYIVEIENDQLLENYRLKKLSYDALQLEIEDAKSQLDKYNIYAKINGLIALNSVKVGDITTNNQLLFTLINNDMMELEIGIDELDIENVKGGQTVRIEIEALAHTLKKQIEGKVVNISPLGNSANGVTTYPVKVLLAGNENIKNGMNASAEIITVSKNDILTLGSDMVTERNGRSFVYVKSNKQNINEKEGYNAGFSRNGDGTKNSTRYTSLKKGTSDYVENMPDSQSGSKRQSLTTSKNKTKLNLKMPQGYRMKRIETGIKNSSKIEIISGLLEGDEVFKFREISSTTDSAKENQNNNKRNSPIGGGGPNMNRRF